MTRSEKIFVGLVLGALLYGVVTVLTMCGVVSVALWSTLLLVLAPVEMAGVIYLAIKE